MSTKRGRRTHHRQTVTMASLGVRTWLEFIHPPRVGATWRNFAVYLETYEAVRDELQAYLEQIGASRPHAFAEQLHLAATRRPADVEQVGAALARTWFSQDTIQ